MELGEAIRSTGSVRSFLDRPVPRDLLAAVLDDARFAPSGGNRQPWKVAVVDDVDLREQLAALMTPVWHEYMGARAAGENPFVLGAGTTAPPVPAPNPMIDNIADVPVVLAIAADLSVIALMDGQLERPPMTGGASIYPFCWNLLLSARSHGLGGVLTTFLSRAEPAAAPLLGLPANHALVATIFLGYPEHQPTKLTRRPVGEFATLNRFDGTPFA